MSLPQPSDWLDALEVEFEKLATGSLGVTSVQQTGRTDAPPPALEGAYLALVSDVGPCQIGLASSPDGCQALAQGLLMHEAGAPPLPQADVADAVCEIVNMLAGCVQRNLRQSHGLQTSLGLPTFFHGPVQPTERLRVATVSLRIGTFPAALLVLHPSRAAGAGS